MHLSNLSLFNRRSRKWFIRPITGMQFREAIFPYFSHWPWKEASSDQYSSSYLHFLRQVSFLCSLHRQFSVKKIEGEATFRYFELSSCSLLTTKGQQGQLDLALQLDIYKLHINNSSALIFHCLFLPLVTIWEVRMYCILIK